MAVYDDLAADKLRLYDSGVAVERRGKDAPRFHYRREADTAIPLVEDEPLRRQCAAFVDAIRSDAQPGRPAREALEVASILARAERILQRRGRQSEPGAVERSRSA
jgi:hypothetical protein